jgi:GNAT superfamily N-acetyltransferase
MSDFVKIRQLHAFRNLGIGSHLLQTAEQEACTRSDIVGIGVGLYAGEDGGYGAAQRLYVR